MTKEWIVTETIFMDESVYTDIEVFSNKKSARANMYVRFMEDTTYKKSKVECGKDKITIRYENGNIITLELTCVA